VLGDGREIGERDANRLDTANKVCQSASNRVDEAAEGFFDEIRGMLEAFGGDAKRSHLLTSTTEEAFSAPQSGASHFQARRNGYG